MPEHDLIAPPSVVTEDAISVEHTASAPAAGVRRRWAPVWHPAGIFVASRLATIGAAAVAADLSPTKGLGGVLNTTWDGGWYLDLAQHGYPAGVPEQAGQAIQSTLGFFPLYPVAVRALHRMGIPFNLGGILVTAVAGFAACLVLWRLVDFLSGPTVADRAVALFCFFPGAMVLSLTYSEALMLALAIGCLYSLVRERWVTAGILAALATATRPNAMALVAACAWSAGVAVWRRRDWRALAAPALAPLGLVAFFAYLAHHTGEAGAYFRTQRQGWDQTLEPASTIRTVSAFVHHPFADSNIALMALGSVFLAVTLVLLVRSRPPGVLVVYTLAVMGMALLTPTMGARPRFLLTAFPLVTVLAEAVPAPAFPSLLAASATLLGAFTVLSMASILATP